MLPGHIYFTFNHRHFLELETVNKLGMLTHYELARSCKCVV